MRSPLVSSRPPARAPRRATIRLEDRLLSVAAATGERDALARLCQALCELLEAAACSARRVERESGVAVDVAAFVAAPAGAEARLAARSPLAEAAPLAGGGLAEPAHARGRSLLVAVCEGRYLLEVEAPGRRRPWPRRRLLEARRLAACGADLVAHAAERDRSEAAHLASLTALAGSLRRGAPAPAARAAALLPLAAAVGDLLGLEERELRRLGQAAALHDIGKVGVPAAILAKKGPLSPVEWAVVRRHTLIAERVLTRMELDPRVVADVAASGERWDGGGVPRGLAGERIPRLARIVSACAAYTALREERPYRPARDHAGALAALRADAGHRFEPAVVEALAGALGPDGAVRPTRLLRVAA